MERLSDEDDIEGGGGGVRLGGGGVRGGGVRAGGGGVRIGGGGVRTSCRDILGGGGTKITSSSKIVNKNTIKFFIKN